MKSLILCGVALWLPACAATASPSSPAQLAHFQACAQEADWLTYQSDAYRYASPRTREQVENQGDPGANATRGLCRALYLDTKEKDPVALSRRCDAQIGEDQRRFGALAAKHDRRIRAFCDEALNRQPG